MVKIVIFIFFAGFCFSACNKKTEKVAPKPIQQENPIEAEEPDTINDPIFTEEEIQAPIETGPSVNDKYFLIAASFSNMSNAENHQKTLLDQGLPAEILTREQGVNSNFYKVSYMSFNNWGEALQTLNSERSLPGKEDVWLLVKK